MCRARTKPSWWPKWPDTARVGWIVERSHWLSCHVRPFCYGLRAVGCGVRETPGPTRGIPLAKLLRGWPCACRCAPAPASPPQRFAAVTHGPGRAASNAYHGPAERTEGRRGGKVREVPSIDADDCPRLAVVPPRRRSALVRLGHACAARTDLCVGAVIPWLGTDVRPHAQQAAKGCSPMPHERPHRPSRRAHHEPK